MRGGVGLGLLLGTAVAVHGAAAPRELCTYVAPSGAVSQVNSIDEVPPAYRAGARCFSESLKPDRPRNPALDRPTGPTEIGGRRNRDDLAAPEAFELDGAIRRVDMPSSIGRIRLRWPRSVEALFGRTPERAMAEAARAVSRAVKAVGFPPIVSNLDLDWQVVFMDEARPDGQIPAALVSNCHPGWMTPPANIYIVADRVAAGCGGSAPAATTVADSALARVLIHEIGHAVEYRLLLEQFGRSRMRAEGFATWFTGHAADFSPLLERGAVERENLALARVALAEGGITGPFRGGADDYARAGAIFAAIVARRGVRGIIDVYAVMRKNDLDLFAGIESRLGWDASHLSDEVGRVVASPLSAR